VVYVDGTGEEYVTPPSDVGHRMARRPSSRRARVVDGYSDSSITESDGLPERFSRQNSETHFVQGAPPQRSSFLYEAAPHRTPSHESFHHPESVPPLLDQENTSNAPPYVASPSEVYMEPPAASHENISQYTQDPPIIHGEPRRFHARRGQPITIGGVRIEVEDDGRNRRHRSRRSRSRSIDSYSSGVSQVFIRRLM
jgi:hypothetical protein